MHTEHRHLVREELLRSIAWIGVGIVGWPILIAEVAWIEATLLTVVGLPVLTWAILTSGAIGLRMLTDGPVQVQSPVGHSISLVLGIMLGGIAAVYLVAVEGHRALAVTTTYVGVTGGAVLWHWYTRIPGSTPNTSA